MVAGPNKIGPLITFYWMRSVSKCELKADVTSLKDSNFKIWSKVQNQSYTLEMHLESCKGLGSGRLIAVGEAKTLLPMGTEYVLLSCQ